MELSLFPQSDLEDYGDPPAGFTSNILDCAQVVTNATVPAAK